MKKNELVGEKIIQYYKNLTEIRNEHPSDIGILVPDQKTGRGIVKMFYGKLNIASNHVFNMNNVYSVNNKKSFYMEIVD